MSEDEGEVAPGGAPEAGGGGGGERGDGDGPGRRLNPVSFKLRFASQREPGRSDVSAVKPLGLPATVTDKFYRRVEPERVEPERAARALARIRRMFACGPRDLHAAPVISSHEYGWHWQEASKMATTKFTDRRLHHHIQDSAWLKARLIVLAADDKLKLK